MLALTGGVGTSSDSTGMQLGGVISWELTPRLGLETSASWLDKQPGASAFSAALSLRRELTKSHPSRLFVEGGFGLHLATYDPKRATDIPAFYQDRMSGTMTNTFVDPAFFGAMGMDVYRSLRVAVRPTVGVTLALDGSNAYPVGTFAVRFEYHFGDRPPGTARAGQK